MKSETSTNSQAMDDDLPVVQDVSWLSRGVSWVILNTLAVMLITVFAGILFSIYKSFVPDQIVALAPEPSSPAAVYASAAPPIDYRQHAPPRGATAASVLPPPLPAYASAPPQHPATRVRHIAQR